MHKPVLLNEVLEIFDPRPGQIYLDATVNGGGHARAILKKIAKKGKVIGLDWDCALIEKLNQRIKEEKIKNFIAVCDNYTNLDRALQKLKIKKTDGILFDLGFGSEHLESSGRGFSFLKDESLDMRFNPQTNELTAEKIIDTWSKEAIENILQKFGEERFARRIADAIVRARLHKKISTTAELRCLVSKTIGRISGRSKINPATRTFQALRIAVNGELENLQKGLAKAVKCVKKGGKVAVISFHSLEDRVVKNFFKEENKNGRAEILTKKPIRPGAEEIKNNPRSRAAKLRAIRII